MTPPSDGSETRDPRSAAKKLEAQLEARERRIEQQREAERKRELAEERRDREAAEARARKAAEAKAKAATRAEEQEVLSAASFPRRLLRFAKIANLVLAIVLALFVLWRTASASELIGELPARTGLYLILGTVLEIALIGFGCVVLHLVLVGIGALLDIRDDVADFVEGDDDR
jgi:colicin import membrane protein